MISPADMPESGCRAISHSTSAGARASEWRAMMDAGIGVAAVIHRIERRAEHQVRREAVELQRQEPRRLRC